MPFELKIFIRKIHGTWHVAMTRRLGGFDLEPLRAQAPTWSSAGDAARALWANPLAIQHPYGA